MLKVAPAPARTSPARAPASPGRVRPSRVTETPARIRLNSRTVVQSRGAVFIYPFRDSPQTLLQKKGGGLAPDSEIAKHDNAAKSVAGFISHRGSSFGHLTRNQIFGSGDSKSVVAFRVIAIGRWLIGRLVSKPGTSFGASSSCRSSAHNVSRIVRLVRVRSTVHHHGGKPIGGHERGKPAGIRSLLNWRAFS